MSSSALKSAPRSKSRSKAPSKPTKVSARERCWQARERLHDIVGFSRDYDEVLELSLSGIDALGSDQLTAPTLFVSCDIGVDPLGGTPVAEQVACALEKLAFEANVRARSIRSIAGMTAGRRGSE